MEIHTKHAEEVQRMLSQLNAQKISSDIEWQNNINEVMAKMHLWQDDIDVRNFSDLELRGYEKRQRIQ